MVSFKSNETKAESDSTIVDADPSSGSTESTTDRSASESCADGGVTWTDLTGFQRDILKAIRRCSQKDTIPTGQTIKGELETRYGEDINNGRLYQNLSHLVECDLLEKGFVDGRTNTYYLREPTVAMLDDTVHRFADVCGIEIAAQDG